MSSASPGLRLSARTSVVSTFLEPPMDPSSLGKWAASWPNHLNLLLAEVCDVNGWSFVKAYHSVVFPFAHAFFLLNSVFPWCFLWWNLHFVPGQPEILQRLCVVDQTAPLGGVWRQRQRTGWIFDHWHTPRFWCIATYCNSIWDGEMRLDISWPCLGQERMSPWNFWKLPATRLVNSLISFGCQNLFPNNLRTFQKLIDPVTEAPIIQLQEECHQWVNCFSLLVPSQESCWPDDVINPRATGKTKTALLEPNTVNSGNWASDRNWTRASKSRTAFASIATTCQRWGPT